MKMLMSTLILMTSLFTFAQTMPLAGDGHEHSENVCSAKNPQICAHLRFLKPLNTKEEGEFILHLLTPENQDIKDLKVKLWMDMGGHGHESAPVEIIPMSKLHYKIQNAWFVMEGNWQVKVNFTFAGEDHLVVIPLKISTEVQNLKLSTDLSSIRKTIFESTLGCDQTVTANEKYMAIGLMPNADKSASVKIQSLEDLNKTLIIPTKNRVVDVKLENDIAYVLTQTTLILWDLKNHTQITGFNTYPNISPEFRWRQKASGFIIKGNQAIITHGNLGITVLNLKTGEFSKIIKMPTASAAQDIDLINEKQAVIAVDNEEEGSFCGLYILDLETLAIIKQIKIENPFPSSVRVLNGNRLMMVYFNAIWKFDLKATLSAEVAEPQRRAWKFPGLNTVDMQGKVYFDDKNMYACFSVVDEQSQTFSNIPKALSLDILKLN